MMDAKKVDVLAVLERCRQDAHCRCSEALGERLIAEKSQCHSCPNRIREVEISDAISAVSELIKAAKDEVLRSQATSHPLKCSLALELGISLPEIDAWMLHAYRRFITAVDRIGAPA